MPSETSPVNGSPPREPKLDDVGTTQNPSDGEDDSSDCESYEDMSRKEMKEYQRYCKQIDKSNGFDLDFVRSAYQKALGYHILPCDLNDPKEFEMAKNCTQYVIERYNELMKGKSRLQLVQIPKANWTRPDDMYNHVFITFDAKDTVSTVSETYQTIVCHYPYEEKIYVNSIVKKGQKEDINFPVDLEDKEECIRMNKCAAVAISCYNELMQGESTLEFVKVVKANRDLGGGYHFYWVTFDAKDTILDQIDSYYSLMEYDPEDDSIALQDHLYREKDGELIVPF